MIFLGDEEFNGIIIMEEIKYVNTSKNVRIWKKNSDLNWDNMEQLLSYHLRRFLDLKIRPQSPWAAFENTTRRVFCLSLLWELHA